MFSKKFWQIKRANLQIVKFKYFYSWQNVLKLVIAFGLVLPLCIVFVIIPKWFFEKLDNLIRDNMPSLLKVDENPEWIKLNTMQKRNEFMMQFKTWE